MFCKFCGKEIDDSTVFCSFCGKKISENILEHNSGNRKINFSTRQNNSVIVDVGEILGMYLTKKRISVAVVLVMLCMLAAGTIFNAAKKNEGPFYQCKDWLPYGIDDEIWGMNVAELEDYTGWDNMTELLLGGDELLETCDAYPSSWFYIGDARAEYIHLIFKANGGLVGLVYMEEDGKTDILDSMIEGLNTYSRYIGNTIALDDDVDHLALWETDKSYAVMAFDESVKDEVAMMYMEKEFILEDQWEEAEDFRVFLDKISNSDECREAGWEFEY